MPRVCDTLVNFEGAAVIHTESQGNSKGSTQDLAEEVRETSENSFTDEKNLTMMLQWNRVMREEMKVPQGYQNVAVLIIKWNEELDQLKTADEVGHCIPKDLGCVYKLISEQVRKLDKLLRQSFNYSTKIVEINIATSPDLQLKKAILKLVCKYNGPHNLLIVYYTGHGSYNELTKQYIFHAYVHPAIILDLDTRH